MSLILFDKDGARFLDDCCGKAARFVRIRSSAAPLEVGAAAAAGGDFERSSLRACRVQRRRNPPAGGPRLRSFSSCLDDSISIKVQNSEVERDFAAGKGWPVLSGSAAPRPTFEKHDKFQGQIKDISLRPTRVTKCSAESKL